MTDPDDRMYFEERAEAEIALAQKARETRVVQVHYELASRYLDRLYPANDRREDESAA